MPDSTPHPLTSPSGVPLAKPRPLWRRILDGALLAKFGLTLLLVWITRSEGCNYKGPPIHDTGAEVLANAPWCWPLLAVVLAMVVVGLVARRYPRVALTAAGLSVLRIVAFGLLIWGVLWGAMHYEPGYGVSLETGIWLAFTALGLMVLLEMTWLLRTAPLLVRELVRHPPWRRWNPWVGPVALLDLAVAGLGILGSLIGWAWAIYDRFQSPPELRLEWVLEWAFQYGLLYAYPVLHMVALAVTAWGLWNRHAWACWAHAFLMGLMLATGIFLGAIADLWTQGWFWPVAALVLAWTVYGFVVAYLFSPHWLERRVCAGCGKKRWLRIERCPVCGERLWIFKDQAAAPVCLACGWGQASAMPLCRACRTIEGTNMQGSSAHGS